MNRVPTFTYDEALHYLDQKEWGSLGIADKVGVLQAVEKEMASRQSREASMVKPKEFELLQAGEYDPHTNEIFINSNLLNHEKYGADPNTHLVTVLHEGRHSYQTQVVAGKTNHHNQEDIDLWTQNLSAGNYISGRENYPRYYNQPVEKDARSYSQEMQRQIQQEREKLINRENMMHESKQAFKAQMAGTEEHATSDSMSKDIFIQQQQDEHLDCDIKNNEATQARLKDRERKR